MQPIAHSETMPFPESAVPAMPSKTCKITLVNDGMSDSVIKVYPAEHESEKIWLNNTPGIERWEEIKRLMTNYAKRGTPIKKPVHYHSSIKDLRTVDITEEDIPMVQLDGAYLEAPPRQEMPPDMAVKLNPSVDNLQLRMEKMEATVNRLAEILLSQNTAKTDPVTVASSPVVETPVLNPSPSTFTCPTCANDFATVGAMKMHIGRFHKEAK